MVLLLLVLALLFGFAVWVRQSRTFSFVTEFTVSDWFLIAAQSLTVAFQIGIAAWTWLQTQPQVYIDFIPGIIGFSYQNKTSEYQALYLTIIVFILLMVLLTRVYDLLLDKREGVRSGIYRLGIYSLIPAVLMLGQSLQMKETPYLMRTSFLVLLLLAIVLLYLRKNLQIGNIAPEQTFATGSKLLLGGLFLLLSDSGAAILLSRLGHSNYQIGVLTIIAMVAAAVFALFNRNERILPVAHSIDLFFAISQIGAPLAFAVLASPPVIDVNGVLTFLPFRPSLYVVLAILALISMVDIVWRFLAVWRAPVGNEPVNTPTISPWTLVAALLIFQHVFPSWPTISIDEYHSSEFYLPWWLLTRFGELPFVDYQPSRGLLNYIPGMLTWLFVDGSMSAQTLLFSHQTAIYIIPAFFCLRKMVGNYIAFFSIFSASMFVGNHAGGIFLSIAALALIFYFVKNHSPIATLWLWLFLSLIITLFATSEGAAFILCSLPLVAYQLYCSYRREPRKLWISLGALVLLLPVLLLPIPPSQIILGAARYLLEQSGVSDVAYSIPWAFPPNPVNSITAGYLWQIIRYSWLLLVVPITILLIKSNQGSTHSDVNNRGDHNHWLFLVAILIFVVVIIQRGGGRVDQSNAFSRPAQTSIVLITCALPLIIFPTLRDPNRRASVILLLSLFFGLIGSQEASLRTAWNINKQVMYAPQKTVSGEEIGLYYIGENVIMDEKQITRQQSIHQVLEQILTSDETYFDVTNRNVSYVFHDRPNPVADTAFYNTPTTGQQHRAIAELEAQKIPLVLIQAENIIHDNSPLSLRGFWLYRYLLINYRPFIAENQQVWMIRKGEEKRLFDTNYKIATRNELVSLLTNIFWMKELYGLPASWGASYDSLASQLAHSTDLLEYSPMITPNGMIQIDEHTWETAASDPALVFDIPSGIKGDMLIIETAEPLSSGFMQVFWTNEFIPAFDENYSYIFSAVGTRFIIPLASAPSWELSKTPRKIRIDLPNDFNGRVTFKRISLVDRLEDE